MLIYDSLLEQYGVRFDGSMPWPEFCALMSGLSPKTALGRIVSIRSEDDAEILKTFTDDMKRIRNEYRERHNNTDQLKAKIAAFASKMR